RTVLRGDVRARAAVRGDGAGLALTGSGGDGVRAVLDGGELVLLARGSRAGAWVRTAAAALPSSFDTGSWHELELRRRGGAVVITVSAAGQGDPVATVRATTGAATPARLSLVSAGGAGFDDVTAAPLYLPRTDVVPDPVPGPADPAYGDEFDGGLGDGWTWLREPAAEVVDGRLRFTVQDADLTGASNSASVLLRDVPDDEWMAETAVTADFGRPDGYPQAGLIAYAGDDHYLRLAVRGHGEPVLTTFQKEMPYGTRTVANSATFGAGEPTTWLRLHHRRDPDTGAHLLRAASSPDGEHWTWSTTHTLPADAELRLGLAAHGGEPVEASFDYLRVYRR
ncbi:beta-xylosidase family glycoside hydrolase, partial [Jiangella rhizosphaerae]